MLSNSYILHLTSYTLQTSLGIGMSVLLTVQLLGYHKSKLIVIRRLIASPAEQGK